VTDAKWCGWYRPARGGRWERLAEAATYDEAWGKLLDAIDGRRGGELLVVPGADDPNSNRAERRAPSKN
jgi:hypothetical protein